MGRLTCLCSQVGLYLLSSNYLNLASAKTGFCKHQSTDQFQLMVTKLPLCSTTLEPNSQTKPTIASIIMYIYILHLVNFCKVCVLSRELAKFSFFFHYKCTYLFKIFKQVDKNQNLIINILGQPSVKFIIWMPFKIFSYRLKVKCVSWKPYSSEP